MFDQCECLNKKFYIVLDPDDGSIQFFQCTHCGREKKPGFKKETDKLWEAIEDMLSFLETFDDEESVERRKNINKKIRG